MMRTFVSINIPEEIKKDILKIQNQLPDFCGKKTKPENLHLTLKFLGEVSENKVEQVERVLHKVQYNSFEAEINSIGIFDHRNSQSYKQRIVTWLNVINCESLQRKVDESLASLFNSEKNFKAHLTIAKVKTIESKKKFLDELRKIEIPIMSFNVNSFYLMKSDFSSEGHIYSIIKKYNLFSEKYKQ